MHTQRIWSRMSQKLPVSERYYISFDRLDFYVLQYYKTHFCDK